jgi:hypothetical protein
MEIISIRYYFASHGSLSLKSEARWKCQWFILSLDALPAFPGGVFL